MPKPSIFNPVVYQLLTKKSGHQSSLFSYNSVTLGIITDTNAMKMVADSAMHIYDETSFKELFDTYMVRVHDYINAISKSEYIAEEVTQELFIILWRKRTDLQAVQNMDQYIFRIARNLAIALLRKAALDNKMAAEFYKRSLKQTNEVLDSVSQRSVQNLIDQAVMKLPPQARKIYFMSRRENMSFDEMAAITGLSRNTIKNHLQKALHDIREYLIQSGYQPVMATLLIKALIS